MSVPPVELDTRRRSNAYGHLSSHPTPSVSVLRQIPSRLRTQRLPTCSISRRVKYRYSIEEQSTKTNCLLYNCLKLGKSNRISLIFERP